MKGYYGKHYAAFTFPNLSQVLISAGWTREFRVGIRTLYNWTTPPLVILSSWSSFVPFGHLNPVRPTRPVTHINHPCYYLWAPHHTWLAHTNSNQTCVQLSDTDAIKQFNYRINQPNFSIIRQFPIFKSLLSPPSPPTHNPNIVFLY